MGSTYPSLRHCRHVFVYRLRRGWTIGQPMAEPVGWWNSRAWWAYLINRSLFLKSWANNKWIKSHHLLWINFPVRRKLFGECGQCCIGQISLVTARARLTNHRTRPRRKLDISFGYCNIHQSIIRGNYYFFLVAWLPIFYYRNIRR